MPPHPADTATAALALRARQLHDLLASYGSCLVAFSGGVDSGLVLAAAARAVGITRVAAFTATSPAVPAAEIAAARSFTAELGVRHLVRPTREWTLPQYRQNGPRRCYFCKSILLATAEEIRAELGMSVVATGTNASDLGDYRPGIAAAAERGARSPLQELSITKTEVRALATQLSLSVADKPATPCLASRIAYGVTITPSRLARIEHAETAIRALIGASLRDLRVRDLGDQVRVEVDAEQLPQLCNQPSLHDAVRQAGFNAPIIVAPYRQGALNQLLPDSPLPTP
jgi:pyridinium-3,5-biscarboxylic acid mononucleotide sulfurtransferase